MRTGMSTYMDMGLLSLDIFCHSLKKTKKKKDEKKIVFFCSLFWRLDYMYSPVGGDLSLSTLFFFFTPSRPTPPRVSSSPPHRFKVVKRCRREREGRKETLLVLLSYYSHGRKTKAISGRRKQKRRK